ncbi:MAG: hypothetical protein HZC36_05125 [Armatimonadetes bacterium]|nr:hypothetical protein [Armatimonadota bacterium]
MTIRASAPGRCGILGAPSDIYGGHVVSCSVPMRATCSLTFGQGEALPEDPTLWLAATARFPVEPCRVEWHSDVPRSSGLAGSTALLAATLACVLKARNEPPDLATGDGQSLFAELVRDIEFKEAGVVCGYQDAYMTVFGGLRSMDFAGKHPIEPGPHAGMRAICAELPFLLVTTGVERLSGSVHGPIRDRWLAGDAEVLSAISRIADIGRVAEGALVNGDWSLVGALLDENQELIKGMGGSGEAIDQLIADCKECGALGARLAGAGMGGTVIALTMEPAALEARLHARGYRAFAQPEAVEGVRYD